MAGVLVVPAVHFMIRVGIIRIVGVPGLAHRLTVIIRCHRRREVGVAVVSARCHAPYYTP